MHPSLTKMVNLLMSTGEGGFKEQQQKKRANKFKRKMPKKHKKLVTYLRKLKTTPRTALMMSPQE